MNENITEGTTHCPYCGCRITEGLCENKSCALHWSSPLIRNGTHASSVRFTAPIPVPVDEDITEKAHNFREYASLMQLPDPTYVAMSEDVNVLLTHLINNGKISAWDALQLGECGQVSFGKCSLTQFPSYQYSEIGREYIQFPPLDAMITLLRWHDPKIQI